MTITVFWFLVVVALFYFGAVVFAIYQGRNVKSSFKVPFALLTFETEGTENTGARSRARTLKRDTGIKPDQSETFTMTGRKHLIFDTSGVNALADDADAPAVIAGISIAYRAGVTETVLTEVIANSNTGRREQLLNVLDRLVHGGNCLKPFQWIVERQARRYHADPKNYDWRSLDLRFPEGDREISVREIAHAISGETRESNKRADRQYREIFATAKPAFDKLFAASEKRPALGDVTRHLMSGGGAYLTIGAGLMERATGTRPTEDEVKDFIDRCPPFRALLVAICFSQYDRCIRDERERSLGKAGRFDMFCAVYLPYCKVFVTNDEGQYKALTAVAELAQLDVQVSLYAEFKTGLVGLADAVPVAL